MQKAAMALAARDARENPSLGNPERILRRNTMRKMPASGDVCRCL